ncbi:MAG: ATP synthase F1 subunit gamma [Anaerolineae bacterium]|nr:ATP synthase F1 subunit gamma [Anaerolineae bacterium]
MATLREIRRRIRSVNSISQVTRAMQMVAASKMRRAQEQVLATRPYASKSWAVLHNLASQPAANQSLHPLLERRAQVRALDVILITSDRGLCGAYNQNIIRASVQFIQKSNLPARIIAVGRRGRDFMLRYGRSVIAEFTDLPPRPGILDVTPIARTAMDDFLRGDVDEVYLAYTDFINTLSQKPTVRRLLPLTTVMSAEQVEEAGPQHTLVGEYIYEPDPVTILGSVLPRFTELQVYQAVLEALASEHSARMVAMRSATENAKELLTTLRLTYNQARQSSITREMLEIAGGAEALRLSVK